MPFRSLDEDGCQNGEARGRLARSLQSGIEIPEPRIGAFQGVDSAAFPSFMLLETTRFSCGVAFR